jgi:hypothetical protein
VAVNKYKATDARRMSTATLVAQASVQLLDVSRCGCLFESLRPMEVGTVGTLRLAVEGQSYVEDVRITRSTAVPGRGSTFRIGAEFLRTRRGPEQSLRHAIGHLLEATLRAGVAADRGARAVGESTQSAKE